MTTQQQQKRKKTPEDYTHKKDSRSEPKAGEYPNYHNTRTRSGHVFSMDDSAGSETITIQHRTGSAIQMRPDGSVQYTTHNGKYEVVFGEDRITVSGARDITVKGDASLRVYGDYNVTCHKDYNLTVMGDLNITAKNKNQLIRGNKDTIAQNETKKLAGSSSGTYLGGYARTASESVSVISKGSAAYFGAGDKVSIQKAGETEEGSVSIRNKKGDTVHQNDDGKHATNVESNGKKVYMVADAGKYSVKADDRINVKTDKEMKVESQDDMGFKTSKGMKMEAATGGVQVQSQGDFNVTAQQTVKVESQGDMHHTAQGDAGFEGSTTHVGRTAGTTHVVGATTNIEGTGGLNLNGGLGQMLSIFQQQLNFDFGDIMQQVQMPSMSSGGAQSTEAEAEADDWTSRLV